MRDLLVRLYPKAWRDRYGAEFATLLDDSGGGWRVFFDVVREAMKMRIPGGRFRQLAAFGVAGLVVAGLASLQMRNVYRSDAVLLLEPAHDTKQGDVTEWMIRLQGQVLSKESLNAIVENEAYAPDRAGLSVDAAIAKLKSDLTIRIAGPANAPHTAVAISYRGVDPEHARAVVQRLISAMIESNLKMPGGATISVLDPASLPKRPASPKRWVIAAAGIVIGLLTGLVFGLIRRWPRIAASGAGMALLAGAISFGIPDSYRAEAVLIPTDHLAAEVVLRKVMTPGDGRELVTGRSRAIRVVAFRAASPGAAAEGLGKLLNDLLDAGLQQQRAQRLAVPSLVFDRSFPPTRPDSPNRPLIAGVGLAGGLLLGAMLQRIQLAG